MQKLPKKWGLWASTITNLRELFQTPSFADVGNYDRWQCRFMHHRLELGFRLAILCYFTFIILQLSYFFSRPDRFRPTWLLIQFGVELGFFLGLKFLQSPAGQKHPGRIFLWLSWLVTFSPQVQASLDGVSTFSIVEWPLMFFAQATLIPVRWYLHLIAQFGVFSYYLISKFVVQLPVLLPTEWMTEEFAVLYYFWICLISNVSVYLYDRLACAQFNARHALEDAYKQLQIEQERSESLLLNILPYPIAQRLKQKPTTIADSFNRVGVLFGDIVGFTELSGQVPAEELVELLNQIFSRFDYLAEQHGLEKIKTIGDAYMVVSGLPVPREDYIEAIADMALDMKQSLEQFNHETEQHFQMRIGIASGPVIAGVIGIRKFIYDLWGDTVNIASRMESHGIADQIQVTDLIYESLKENYYLEKRGIIEVKGKGEMTTYLLKKRLKWSSQFYD
ncbi:MAG: adenylate/guanylate cyclase domain-containing protein [Oscillatoriales cyanobacterium RM2_1_1]|nr:adenylate/guanylate cyclase domain-containing protein [Oscillatoriales cyanobacterium RM2_1_1]